MVTLCACRTPLAAILSLLLAGGVLAQEVRVIKTTATKTSLDLTGLVAAGGGPASEFRRVLEADLVRSGWFTLVAPAAFTVSGSANESGDQLDVRCQVLNVTRAEMMLNKVYRHRRDDARRLAHLVADDIIFAIKGIRGINAGRIVMVGRRGGAKEIFVCDADGGNLRQVTRDGSISLAPAWSPDGQSIVYTSFKSRFPDVYLIDLRNMTRTCLASYPGLNMAGAFSPDGRRLALVLSKDGNPELYVKELAEGTLTRLTYTRRAGEASPAWSPDGSQLVYVADPAGPGAPQLYVLSPGGSSRLLTSRGRENTAPDWGTNGWIAFCSRREGLYGIYILNPATGEERRVSPADAHYEDPAWCSDGRHLVCARQESGGSKIYLLDTLGDPPVCLTPYAGDWTSPAWWPR